MNTKLQAQIDEAKSHFGAWRFVEAYNLLRRYFDRIPFQWDRGHAECIGMFVRVLAELGKTNELNFYVGELERHYQKNQDPLIGYTLAVVYRGLPQAQSEQARKLFENVIQSDVDLNYRIRAKMMLAHYYDWKYQDISACRQLIDSIDEPEDNYLRQLWLIWKAKILRDEKNFEKAESILLDVLASISPSRDWYAFYSAKVVLAILYLKRDEVENAGLVVNEVRELFAGRNFKSLKIQLDELERQLREKSTLGTLHYQSETDGSLLSYQNKKLRLKKSTPAELLLRLLVTKKVAHKELIVQHLYDRDYNGIADDKLIYYHVHALRKRLGSIGIPAEAIIHGVDGYRFVPEVENHEGELVN